MLTRKHFTKAAEIMRRTRPNPDDFKTCPHGEPAAWQQWRMTVRELADWFIDENPHFDPGRFWDACEK